VVLEEDGFGPVVFCNGTPRDDEEVVLVDTGLAKWAEVLTDLPSEIHTVVAVTLTCPSCGLSTAG
jgi:hypothetical protein